MSDLPPILVADLFREINQHLLSLLCVLAPDDWHRPTSSSQRNVKDIASHLLDGNVRRPSFIRDANVPPGGPGRSRRCNGVTGSSPVAPTLLKSTHRQGKGIKSWPRARLRPL